MKDTIDRGTYKQPVLLPIAGGKGGVGKSVIAANIAIALAQLGYHTIAADLDLGGSNLYSYLGISNNHMGIGDFIKQEKQSLSDFLVQTGVPNLHFLPGDGTAPFMANITFHQKKRIISGLEELAADFIIMDLGAGSSYNVLDFFGLSRRGLLVTTPEYPSIIAMLGFLKNFLFREFEAAAKKNKPVRDVLNSLFYHRRDNHQLTITDIRREVVKVDTTAEAEMAKTCANFRPIVLFNMGEHWQELKLIKQFSRGLQKVLDIEADYLGFIFADRQVPHTLKQRKPLLLHAPDSMATQEIKQIAKRLLKFLDGGIENSGQLLMDSTMKYYQKMNADKENHESK
jgi:flagellar biosynthesis protein FlhG